jgi:hypothetical protein
MRTLLAFPIPTDAATAAWAGPVFALMALTTVAVLIWQAVRYFRASAAERENADSDSLESDIDDNDRDTNGRGGTP